MTHRLVVPSALVELLLAEQTTATRLSTRLGLCETIALLVLCNMRIKDGASESVLDNLFYNIQSKFANTGAAELLNDPVTMDPMGLRIILKGHGH